MPIFSRDTGDYIGVTTYIGDYQGTASLAGRVHYRVTTLSGRKRAFTYYADAVKWLNVQYDRTH